MENGGTTYRSVPDISLDEFVGLGIHANIPGQIHHAVALYGSREGHNGEGRWIRISLDDFFLARHGGELVRDLGEALGGRGHLMIEGGCGCERR